MQLINTQPGWRRTSVVRTLVSGLLTFPALCPIDGRQETTLWVNCTLWSAN